MRRLTLLGAAALPALLVLSGCKMDTETAQMDPVCECAETERFLPCECTAKGTDTCECTVKPRGYITEPNSGGQVPIYQSDGVNDDQAAAATTNIIAGFNDLTNGNKDALEGKLKEIRIVPAASYGYYDYEVSNGKIIFKIQYDKSSNDTRGWADRNGVPAKWQAG